MSDQYLGEIRAVGFNFAPQGWAICDGQILPIESNTALFSLLGTQYGGDGRTNFALPNFQGCVPVHQGNGPGLSPYYVGQSGGEETVSLVTSQIPGHTHQAMFSDKAGTTLNPSNGVPAVPVANARYTNLYTTAAPNVMMDAAALAPTGGSQPHNNLGPYLTVNFIIALEGIFPPRN